MMGWVNWTRKPSEPFALGVATLGVDLNATRLRAMTCEAGRPPRPVLLDDPLEELDLAVSLEKRTPEAGRAGRLVERKTPHLGCYDFLNEINLPRHWEGGRHRLNAVELLSHVFAKARAALPKSENLTLTLPPYLIPTKVTALAQLMEKAKLPLRGSILLPLALAATTDAPDRRPSQTLVIDCDDHALSISLIQNEVTQARLLASAVHPRLSLRVWKDRLLNGLADRCVRVCRRDPRDSAAAEQALFEQIDDALERLRHGQRVEMVVRSTHWYQNLIQSSEDFEAYCAPLIKASLAAIHELVQSSAPEPPQGVWLTHAAGRLPGLATALHTHSAERTGLAVLPADAGPRAAAVMAGRWARDELPRTHLDTVVLLPELPQRDSSPTQYRAANGTPASSRGVKGEGRR